VAPVTIKGLITRGTANEQSPFLVWDVSEQGLGIWSSSQLQMGETIKVTIGQPYLLILTCKVRWADDKPTSSGFRCGLEVVDNARQLASLYEKFRQEMEESTD